MDLLIACSVGDIHEVTRILEENEEIQESINKCIYNDSFDSSIAAIHLAVEKGYKEICESLLLHGANANILDSEGYAPLDIACSQGNVEITELLLKYEADPNRIVDGVGLTTIHQAVCSGSLETVQTVLDFEGIKNPEELINHQDEKGWSPLHYACQHGYCDIAELLIAKKANVHLTIQFGRTALHLAAFEGHIDCAKLLLKYNCDVNTQDQEGWTAIILACQEGHSEIVELICDKSPDLSLTSKTKRNAIHAASYRGHRECLEHILKAKGGKSLVSAKNIEGWTPLHFATKQGHIEIVQKLLTDEQCKVKVDINAQTNILRTALHFAVLEDNLEIVKCLLESNADISIKDSKKWTALHLASQHGFTDIAMHLIKHLNEHPKGAEVINETIESGRNALHLAAFEGCFEIAKHLVRCGINYNHEDKDQWTALHLAVQQGHEEIVKVLLKAPKINVNIKARNGRIPLHSACFHGRLKIVNLLLHHDSQKNVADIKGWTPLHLCSQENNLEVVKVLIRSKPRTDVNIQAQNGSAPIHLACIKGNISVVQHLLDNKANVNIEDNNFWTPLSIACRLGFKEIVDLLIARGANATAKIKGGRNVLHVVAFNGFIDICKLLTVNGIEEINGVDDEGWTPLHLAAQEGHLDIVKHLVEKGANFRASSKTGRTPLHMCSSCGHVGILEYLLSSAKQHVDPKEMDHVVNCTDKRKWTPFHSACNKGHLKAAKILRQYEAKIDAKISIGRNALHLSCFNGHKSIAEFLLQEKINLRDEDEEGWTALHLAAQEGKIDVVRLLLSKGADPNIKAKNGRIALHLAAMHGHSNVVKLLVNCGSLVDVQDNFRWTPLHSACNNCHTDTVRILLRHGAIAHDTIDTGRNCLHLAGYKGGTEICKILLQNKCNLLKQDIDGWTPLHLACQEGQFETVELFLDNLDYQQEVNIQANDKRTPLQLACLKGQTKVVDLLIKKGASCDVVDSSNWAPLTDAVHGKHFELVKLLVKNKVDINVQTKRRKETPLHLALYDGNIEMAIYLIEREARCDLLDTSQKNALHIAVRSGYLNVIEKITSKHGTNMLHEANDEVQTPLQIAIETERLDTVALLLQKGALHGDKVTEAKNIIQECQSGQYEIEFLIQESGLVINEN